MENENGETRLDEEVSEVECQLQQRLASMHDQRDAGADELCEHQLRRRREEQPEHQRDLAQRHRMRVAPELDVHDEDLGEAETAGQHPPLKLERRMDRAQVTYAEEEDCGAD